VDEELARVELTASVTALEAKLNKLNDLRFWIDNMVIDKLVVGRINLPIMTSHVGSISMLNDRNPKNN
jgi:hypothetical protein